MTQFAFIFTAADEHEHRCRHYARIGNVDMCNVYLHRWGCEVRGAGIQGFIAELRAAAVGKCLSPDAIGDPELFVGMEASA